VPDHVARAGGTWAPYGIWDGLPGSAVVGSHGKCPQASPLSAREKEKEDKTSGETPPLLSPAPSQHRQAGLSRCAPGRSGGFIRIRLLPTLLPG